MPRPYHRGWTQRSGDNARILQRPRRLENKCVPWVIPTNSWTGFTPELELNVALDGQHGGDAGCPKACSSFCIVIIDGREWFQLQPLTSAT